MLLSSWSDRLTLLPYTLSAMNILFVHTALPGVQFTSSIAALSSWLKAHGHSVQLLPLPLPRGHVGGYSGFQPRVA